MKSPGTHRKTTSASFHEPTAVLISSPASNLLKDTVYVRCNTLGSGSSEEIASAVNALAQTGSSDAHKFLVEIGNKRVGMLPLYRRAIRDLAQEAVLVA